jgi:hypothetical protein
MKLRRNTKNVLFNFRISSGNRAVNLGAYTVTVHILPPNKVLISKDATLIDVGINGECKVLLTEVGTFSQLGQYEIQLEVKDGTSMYPSDIQTFMVVRNNFD